MLLLIVHIKLCIQFPFGLYYHVIIYHDNIIMY